MGKYFAVISNSIKKNLAYRVNNFIMMFSVLFSFGVMFYLWSSIYRQGNQIGNYSFREIITYYVFVTIFEFLFTSNTAWGIGEEIKNGQITNSVLKPIGYLEYKFSQSVGSLLYRIMFFTPVIILVLYLLSDLLINPVNNFVYLFFIILAILSYVLNFLIYYTVGIATFWMGDGYGFFFACMVIISFMQGQWMPLDLLPRWIISFGDFLPFKYLFFVPVSVASGRTSPNYLMFIIPLIWISIVYLFAQFLYKKGIRKYEGYGA
ncbi:MAG: hypothetical protein ACD_56C00006G0004 [uncultured bacterium]|nr:MAG: hypothetical protein ACD_56C00006G0004 [uncultured bacterium]